MVVIVQYATSPKLESLAAVKVNIKRCEDVVYLAGILSDSVLSDGLQMYLRFSSSVYVSLSLGVFFVVIKTSHVFVVHG